MKDENLKLFEVSRLMYSVEELQEKSLWKTIEHILGTVQFVFVFDLSVFVESLFKLNQANFFYTLDACMCASVLPQKLIKNYQT